MTRIWAIAVSIISKSGSTLGLSCFMKSPTLSASGAGFAGPVYPGGGAMGRFSNMSGVTGGLSRAASRIAYHITS